MDRDALFRGLGDSDIQQDVLGHNDQDMTLEDTIKSIEAKEAGKRSQATLQNPSAATVSSYKLADREQRVVKCRNCGKADPILGLLQKYCTCEIITLVCCSTGWKIVFASNRFTHPAESWYAPIEGEALAVVYGLESARHFVLGCDNLVVATERKPLLGVLNNRRLGDIKNERLLSLKEETLPYRFSIIHIPDRNKKRRMQTRGNPLMMQKNSSCIVILRSRTPPLVLNRVSALLRPPLRGNPTYQLIWKKSLLLLRPPISATFAPLHGPRSRNTPYAMKIFKISKKDRRRFPGHHLTIGSCPGYTRIRSIQGWTQQSGWSYSVQQQDCYPITTKNTNPRHTAFCSSRCLLYDFKGWI